MKKKTQSLIQVSMKLGEAVYKNQQKSQNKKDDGDESKDSKAKGENKENVVDADFEDVKEDKEKAPKIKKRVISWLKRDYLRYLRYK